MKDSTKEMVAASGNSGDLLKNRFIGRLMKSRWYPGIFQWIAAIVFSFIIYVLLVGPPSAHSNFGTALTWVLWWPLIPFIFLLAGRFWCGICPFGSLNDVVQKFVGHNRPIPTFLKKYGIWIIDGLFILITWVDHVIGMVESPWNSGIIMLLIVTAVIATSAIWERRSWCRYLCFLGGLSSNYSQTSVLALRGTEEKCSKCKTATCYKGNKDVPGCPMFEFPKTMKSNAQCNLCGDCVKTCHDDSLTLKLRIPTKELWLVHKPQLAAAFLAAVIMGIVFLQNITMLEGWQSVISGLENFFKTESFVLTFSVVFLIVLPLPIALLAFASWIAKKLNGQSLLKNFTKFGYAIIPIDVAGHIAHNLFHLLREGGAVILTGATFFGKEVTGITPALASDSIIQILQYILIALGIVGSLYTAYRIGRNDYTGRKAWISALPYIVLILFLGVINIVLFSLPMMMRLE